MTMLKSLFGKLQSVRYIEWVGVLVALGVLFVLSSNTLGAGGGESSELERRLERVLGEIEGAGKVRVMVATEQAQPAFLSQEGVSSPRATGAVIVAEGAADVRVKLELIRAVSALLGIPEQSVEVFGMRAP